MVAGLRSDSAWAETPFEGPGSACWNLCPSDRTVTSIGGAALTRGAGHFVVPAAGIVSAPECDRAGYAGPGRPTLDGGRPGGGPDPLPLIGRSLIPPTPRRAFDFRRSTRHSHCSSGAAARAAVALRRIRETCIWETPMRLAISPCVSSPLKRNSSTLRSRGCNL